MKTMETSGQFVFRCEANNSVQETGKSGDTFLTVDGGEFEVIKLCSVSFLYQNIISGFQ